MSPLTRREKEAKGGGTKSRFAIRFDILLVALSFRRSASGCGVRQGQEKIEKAREVQEQVEDSQRGLEKKLQEGQEELEEDR